MTVLTTTSSSTRATPTTAPLSLYFDGQCPMCQREAAMLLKMDKNRGNIAIVDITDPAFDPATIGRTPDQVMARIHALTPDARVIEGMEVFRHAYKAVGKGWLLAPTGWPIIRPIVDAFYRWFARNRVKIGHLIGRTDCDNGACTPRG